MKKMFYVLVCLVVSYLLLDNIVADKSVINNNYDIYRKEHSINIDETITKNSINNHYIYDYKINIDENIFDISVLNKFDAAENIVNINFFEDENYECIFIEFKENKDLTDIVCKDEKNIYYDYSSLTNISSKLEKAVNELEEYDYKNYIDNIDVTTNYSLLNVYESNQLKDLVFSITDYKGLYIIDEEVENIKLFDKDIYNQKLSIYIDKYYFVADYNDQYDYKKFYLIDLENGNKYEIMAEENLSKNSYIVGSYENSIYIVDMDNKKQFEVNISKKTMKIVGDKENGMLYYNGKTIENVPSTRFTIEEVYFIEEDIKFKNYNFITKIDFGENKSFAYYYKENENKYDVYKIINNKHIKYLFSIDNLDYIDTFTASGNYLVWQEDSYIKYYSDATTIRTIIKSNELTFNEDIIFSVYNK